MSARKSPRRRAFSLGRFVASVALVATAAVGAVTGAVVGATVAAGAQALSNMLRTIRTLNKYNTVFFILSS